MKRIIFLFMLLTSTTSVLAQNEDVRANRIIADYSFMNPVRDTIVSPGRVGEQRYRVQDSSVYVSIAMAPGVKRWTKQAKFGDIVDVGWAKTGNSGINQRTNFFGTTENSGVSIKTNNRLAGRWDSLQRLQVENMTAMNDTASDFEIILIPDIQNQVDLSGSSGAGRSIFQWIAENETSQNIKAVIGLGDITNAATAAQLDTADAWFDILDAADIHYVPTIGNHDYNSNQPATRNAANFLAEFGPARIGAKSWYGGNYAPAPENFWTNLDIMGRPFSILSLEFFPRNAVLAWADSLLYANPTRTWIYVTHGYLTSFGERSKDTSQYGNNDYVIGGSLTADNSGQEQWDNFVKKHGNIAFVFNGHFAHNAVTQWGYTSKFSDVGINGNVVHQLFTNYQVDTAGGNGFFVRLQFKPAQNKLSVKYYSKYVDRYDSRVDSFTYLFPNISTQSNSGIQGSLAVSGEARFDGATSFQRLTKSRIPYMGDNSIIKDTNSMFFNQVNNAFQASKVAIGSTTPLTTTVPFWLQGTTPTGVVSSHSTPGFRQAMNAGAPGTFYVTHSGGSFGLTIQRASADNGSANLTFFKTRSSNFSTLGASVASDNNGRIYWQGVGSDGATIAQYATFYDFVEGAASGYPYGGFMWNTSGSIVGNNINTMYLSGDGQLRLGGTGGIAASAVVDLQGTTRGFLTPRLTAVQRAAIGSPATGLLVYDTDSLRHMQYNGSGWVGYKLTTEGSGGGGGGSTLTISSPLTGTSYDGSAPVSIGCATCVTSAASLTANSLMIGSGSQGSAVTTTGTGVLTFLGTPSSANLRSALTDENGTGVALFNGATTPDFTTGLTIGTGAASGTFLRGNGTNYIPSTLTIPNTSTANRIVYSTATSVYGESANLTYNGTQLLVQPASNTASTFKLNIASGSTSFQVGSYSGFPQFTTMHLGNIVDDGTNYFVFGDGITVSGFNVPSGGALSFRVGHTEAMHVDANRRVGIGATPSAVLHLKAGIATAGFAPLKFTSGTNLTTAEAGVFEYNGSNFFATATATNRRQMVLSNVATPSSGTILVGNGTDWTITAAGSVTGLPYIAVTGTSTLTGTAVVSTGSNDFSVRKAGVPYLDVSGATETVRIGSSSGANVLTSQSAGTVEITGNVGIGITPTVALDVVGDVSLNSGGTVILNISEAGQVVNIGTVGTTGINIDAGTGQIVFDAATEFRLSTGLVRMDAYGAGTATFDGSGNITSVSDGRAKHSIKPFKYGLKEILGLKTSTFIYNNDKSNTVMSGFIAQDVQAVIPSAVHVSKSGMLSLETNAIIAALVNGMQEQQNQIEVLKAEIKKLKNK